MNIDLPELELSIILDILEKYVPHHEVWAFGSRVTHTAKKFSDLDLVIITTEPLAFSKLAGIKEAFSESDLAIKVDVLDWSRIDSAFQQIIEKTHIILKRVSSNEKRQ